MNPLEQQLLLKRFEPIIVFTEGESFFPWSVDDYLRESSLWYFEEGHSLKLVAPEGKLTTENLAEHQVEGLDRINYLKFIEPVNITELAAYLLKEGREEKLVKPKFKPSSSRLTRVGFLARIVDSLFALSLLARGRVPGDTALAARRTYQRQMLFNPQYRYYARVVENEGWIALQYWYFYPFNDWRSSFKGANDHEADWEMVTVYVYKAENGEYLPEWVACSNHDYEGDDLRRHWRDPELQSKDFHPIVYVGAGSHAHYFRKGEYLAEVGIPFLTRVNALFQRWADFWRQTFRYQVQPAKMRTDQPFFRIPFVDYARGDGLSVGYGQQREWDNLTLLDPVPDWVNYYHGLWGFYTRDPFAGENAPGGPRFNRNGTVRRAWYDPFGWVGLDKVPPPTFVAGFMQSKISELEHQQTMLREEIAGLQIEQYKDGLQMLAIHDKFTTNTQLPALTAEVQGQFNQLRALRKQLAQNDLLLENLQDEYRKIGDAQPEQLRAHLIRPPQPEKPSPFINSRLAEIWSAISIGVMIFGLIILGMFAREWLVYGALILMVMLMFIEALFKGQTFRFIYAVTLVLAIFSAGILIYEFFWPIVIVLVVAASFYVILQNIREL